ncbi:MAG: hypothetical protein L6R43_00505 [Planctomycetes bacterium]|nr:hypothetical protein [Planctomycetota bacterium]
MGVLVHGMGWVPDYPDLRDYASGTPEIEGLLETLKFPGTAKEAKAAKAGLPAAVDLRPWCAPVEDQGSLGSCTANAAVGVMEYSERRAYGRHLEASRLFNLFRI